MSYRMTEEEFADKVESEGGLLGAIFGYGLGPGDLQPGYLKELFERYEPAFDQMRDFMDYYDDYELGALL